MNKIIIVLALFLLSCPFVFASDEDSIAKLNKLPSVPPPVEKVDKDDCAKDKKDEKDNSIAKAIAATEEKYKNKDSNTNIVPNNGPGMIAPAFLPAMGAAALVQPLSMQNQGLIYSNYMLPMSLATTIMFIPSWNFTQRWGLR